MGMQPGALMVAQCQRRIHLFHKKVVTTNFRRWFVRKATVGPRNRYGSPSAAGPTADGSSTCARRATAGIGIARSRVGSQYARPNAGRLASATDAVSKGGAGPAIANEPIGSASAKPKK